MGRKRVAQGQATRVITVRLGEDEFQRVTATAAKFGLSVSAFSRTVLIAAGKGGTPDLQGTP